MHVCIHVHACVCLHVTVTVTDCLLKHELQIYIYEHLTVIILQVYYWILCACMYHGVCVYVCMYVTVCLNPLYGLLHTHVCTYIYTWICMPRYICMYAPWTVADSLNTNWMLLIIKYMHENLHSMKVCHTRMYVHTYTPGYVCIYAFMKLLKL